MGDIELNMLKVDEMENLKFYYMKQAGLERNSLEDVIMGIITEARDSIEDCIVRGNS